MESNLSFLLIEDNLIDQLVTKELLKKVLDARNVAVTNNGKEGIQWLNNYKPTDQSLIILLDVQMPVMNGLEFLNEYDKLSDELKKQTQIYVLSSTLDPDEIKEIEQNNYVKELLSKPFPIDEFKKKIYFNAKSA
ncbi:CheY-like chemotaxis protein [Flavobacterium sp. 270]|uniref:response regulator n=1 Tax=Flavobacterium sp. 270 TaxID=2512114 RepID=UPI0010658828|nr:response regulator [Flavobacterium sp. 270]TDW44330.1 CheY-like chemotaxis protein [Flavobacterium sp. 270]